MEQLISMFFFIENAFPKGSWIFQPRVFRGYVSFSGDVYHLGGGFKYFLFSSLLAGEMIQFDEYFSNGLKPPTRPWFHIRP